MMTLDEIAICHQTDRASVFTRTYGKPHDYARHYDKLFTPLRDQPVKLLEIGSASGEGIKMWRQYFAHPDTHIFGVDAVKDTCAFNTPGQLHSVGLGTFTFAHGDQGKPDFWERFISQHWGDFDIVLDDGSHINTDIIVSFIALWQHVKPGGFYAIEDLNTAYGGDYFVKPNLPNHMDFIKGKLDEINRGGDIESAYFFKELVVFQKARV